MTSPTDKNLDQTAGKGVKDIEVLETDQDIAITETSLQCKVSSSKQDSSQVTPTESFENDLGVRAWSYLLILVLTLFLGRQWIRG